MAMIHGLSALHTVYPPPAAVRNEYTFHAKVHEWLATPGAVREVETLNSRVYAELFLTPESDRWLGLAPQDAFSALENGGLVQISNDL